MAGAIFHNGKRYPEGGGGGGSLSDMNDVELTSLSDGQTLVWDATNLKWVNGNSGGGGGGFSITQLSPTVGMQDISTLTLLDSILNYDIIMVMICRETSAGQQGTFFIPSALIDQSTNYRRYRAVCVSGSQNVDACFDFYFQNNNQLVYSYRNGAFFYGCWGLKF